jgi:hypothetical protein
MARLAILSPQSLLKFYTQDDYCLGGALKRVAKIPLIH